MSIDNSTSPSYHLVLVCPDQPIETTLSDGTLARVVDPHQAQGFPRPWPGEWTSELAEWAGDLMALDGRPLRAFVVVRGEGWLRVVTDVTDSRPTTNDAIPNNPA